MESDEECDPCAAQIVAAVMIQKNNRIRKEISRRTTESEKKTCLESRMTEEEEHPWDGNYATLYKELRTDEQLFQKYLHIALPMYEFMALS